MISLDDSHSGELPAATFKRSAVPQQPSAMRAIRIEHSDPAQHRASIMQQMRHFWMDDHLCDVVLKSYDG